MHLHLSRWELVSFGVIIAYDIAAFARKRYRKRHPVPGGRHRASSAPPAR